MTPRVVACRLQRRLRLQSVGLAARRLSSAAPAALVPALPMAELPAVRSAPAARAVLGIVQIPTDYVLEKEGASIVELFPGVEMSLQKMVFGSDKIDADTYQQAADNITAAAATFLPRERCTVLGVACTSLSFTLGPAHIDSQLRAANPDAATTDMARAQAAALHALGVSRVALVTPYIQELADANARTLEAAAAPESQQVSVVSRATMHLERDELTSQVDQQTLRAWVEATDCAEAEAVVIGCSAFRAAERGFIDELEGAIGKPGLCTLLPTPCLHTALHCTALHCTALHCTRNLRHAADTRLCACPPCSGDLNAGVHVVDAENGWCGGSGRRLRSAVLPLLMAAAHCGIIDWRWVCVWSSGRISRYDSKISR
jgi:maleate isomerase